MMVVMMMLLLMMMMMLMMTICPKFLRFHIHKYVSMLNFPFYRVDDDLTFHLVIGPSVC